MHDAALRPMAPQDVKFAARLHGNELPHGLFPRLGTRFLRGYYRAFVESPHAVAFVTPSDGPAAGYLVGTTDHHAHHRWMLRRHGLRLGLLGALGLAINPDALWLFLRTRVGRYARALLRAAWPTSAGGSVTRQRPPSGGPVAVLMHVAVAPSARGTGFGRQLTQAFAHHAHAAGCRDIRLVTRAGDGAGAFYETLGWQRVDERGRDGSVVAEYRFPSPETSPT